VYKVTEAETRESESEKKKIETLRRVVVAVPYVFGFANLFSHRTWESVSCFLLTHAKAQ
jgi:hypothetical protein